MNKIKVSESTREQFDSYFPEGSGEYTFERKVRKSETVGSFTAHGKTFFTMKGIVTFGYVDWIVTAAYEAYSNEAVVFDLYMPLYVYERRERLHRKGEK